MRATPRTIHTSALTHNHHQEMLLLFHLFNIALLRNFVLLLTKLHAALKEAKCHLLRKYQNSLITQLPGFNVTFLFVIVLLRVMTVILVYVLLGSHLPFLCLPQPRF